MGYTSGKLLLIANNWLGRPEESALLLSLSLSLSLSFRVAWEPDLWMSMSNELLISFVMDFYFTRQTQLYNFNVFNRSIDRPLNRSTSRPTYDRPRSRSLARSLGPSSHNWAIELQHEKRLNIWTWARFWVAKVPQDIGACLLSHYGHINYS